MPGSPSIALDARIHDDEWIVPAREDGGFSRYLEIVWAGRWIVLLAVIASLAGAAVYLTRATKVYQAHASMLVTPLPTADALSGLGLIQSSSDPLRDIETGAGFVTTTTVAQRVKVALHDSRTPQELLQHVTATPVAESDTVDIAATDSSAARAQRLANAFINGTIADRSAALHEQLSVLIPALQVRLKAVPVGDSATQSALAGQLAELEQLNQGKNPNLRLLAPADLPSSPISPRKTLTVVAAAFGGLVLGIGLVFLIQLLDPRLRREEDLRQRFQLPVLARVPRAERRFRRRRSGPMFPEAVSPEATDAYRSLRSVLLAGNRHRSETPGGRIVLVTGPSPSDGKSTTAINLASALADYSERVTLIEGDIRRPSIGAALGFTPEGGVEGVLSHEMEIENALTPVETGSTHVQMLLANRNGAAVQPVSPESLHELLIAARGMSDWVVVDAPPLIYAPDLLSAAGLLDAVLLVVRLGNTNMRNLEEIAEMLAQHGIRPTGFVVVGTSGRPQYY